MASDMVMDHSDNEIKKPTATTLWATPSSSQKEIFDMNHLIDRIEYTTAFIIPVMEHWLE